MRVSIRFNRKLKITEGGYLPEGTGNFFPFEVVDTILAGETLALKPPTRLEFEDQVLVLQWRTPEKTIGVCINITLVAQLSVSGR